MPVPVNNDDVLTNHDILKCSRFIKSSSDLTTLANTLDVTAESVRQIKTDYGNPDVSDCAYHILKRWLKDGNGPKTKAELRGTLAILRLHKAAER